MNIVRIVTKTGQTFSRMSDAAILAALGTGQWIKGETLNHDSESVITLIKLEG